MERSNIVRGTHRGILKKSQFPANLNRQGSELVFDVLKTHNGVQTIIQFARQSFHVTEETVAVMNESINQSVEDHKPQYRILLGGLFLKLINGG